ncbi:hypothetical protein THMIRHAT_02780 [Thiosulfativibrio zosterae]|uniref:diguanylate cyclase n=2 Tax=Thiosulfativibrio zosterae TaxID=2675053 RepID=A0A6F8PKA6_9GAMM|nr:hypothetical protein THMIRHAT_02780 [Thiosulfativibrio zosterae]
MMGLLFISSFAYADQMLVPESSSSAEPQELQKITLQINWNHQFQFAGFYAAIKQGYYKELGLDLSVRAWQPGMVVTDEVVSGRADFGVGYSTQVADYIKGKSLKLIMSSFQYSPMILLSHEPVTDLGQLGGKRVMHSDNLQILGVLNKARSLATEPIVSVSPSANLQDFVTHKVDFYAAYSTNEPFRLKQMGVTFYTVDPKMYGIQSYADLVVTSEKLAQLQPAMVQKFRQASIKGWSYALGHKEEMVDYIIANYPVVKTRDALLFEAQQTERFVKTGATPIGNVEIAKLLATASEAYEVGMISRSELLSFKPENFIFNDSNYLFTPEELNYLKDNPVIRVGSDPDWEPFEFVNDQQQPSGVSVEYFKLFEKQLGVKFEFNTTKTWSEVVEGAKKGEYDIYSCAVATPERKKYMNFTAPYLSFPMVLIGGANAPYIEDYSHLNGQVVSVVKGYWSHEFLTKYFPDIKLLLVNNVQEGLEAVVQGKAFVYSGNLGVVNYSIQRHGLSGLHVVGQASDRFELAIGVQANNPVLLSIMQKVLANVTQEDRQKIFDKWFHLELVQRLDTAQIYKIIFVVGLVVLLMLVWGLFFRYQKNKKQDYINQIHELTYASLIEVEKFHTVWASQAYQALTGYSMDELLQTNYFTMADKEMTESQKHAIARQVLGGNAWTGEVVGLKKNGESYSVELTLTPQKNIWGKVTQVWATRVDITDKKRIEQLAILDDLTGTYNRRYFNEKIVEEVNRSKRDQKTLAVAMFDIDHFKMINDHYGHQRGDEVLKAVSDVIKESFHRSNEFCFRMGGEEFLVLSSFKTEVEFMDYLIQLKNKVESLKIENPLAREPYLTISVGAGFWTTEEIPFPDQIYHSVDAALYEAKANGRNQVVMTALKSE